MPISNAAAHPVNILVIGRDPGILQVVLRLLNEHKPANYHAIGSTEPEQARSLFAGGGSGLLFGEIAQVLSAS